MISKTLQILSIFLTTILLNSCVTRPPKWGGKIYFGDHKRKAIARDQSVPPIPKTVQCSDKQIDGYTCMSHSDFLNYYETFVLGCQVWKKKP